MACGTGVWQVVRRVSGWQGGIGDGVRRWLGNSGCLMQRKLPMLGQRSHIRAFSSFGVDATEGVCPAEDGSLKSTPLYDYHVQLGADMAPYAGWKMPLQYSGHSVIASHKHTREKASLFDVSHMCQAHLLGDNASEFLEQIVVADVKELPEFQGVYTLMTNEQGGIIDDLIVTRHHDRLHLVLNAGCAENDLKHIGARLKKFSGVAILHARTDLALLALQGPASGSVLQRFVKDVYTEVGGIPVVVSRTGYTGEDGFEISVKSRDALSLASLLIGEEEVKPAGLAVRDSLRLESGLCLYGNDLDETTTPIEAGLRWTLGKRQLKEGSFPGKQVILDQIENKPPRRRVGLVLKSGIARSHAKVYAKNSDTLVGEITSGSFSPLRKKGIAMAYVKKGHGKVGNTLEVEVRGKRLEATVSKMPFHPTKYYTSL